MSCKACPDKPHERRQNRNAQDEYDTRMKIGIVIDATPPGAGGGYVFQGELLDAIVKLADTSLHQFVIFGEPEYLRIHFADLTTSGKVQLAASGTGVQGMFQRVVQRVFGDVGAPRSLRALSRLKTRITRDLALSARRFAGFKTGFERAVARSKVECLWFLSPRIEITDVPYITIVWDLQHRLQPWFPELSSGGEWEAREESYAWFLQRATKVIVGTSAGREELERFYRIPQERIAILPHPTPGVALTAPPATDPAPPTGVRLQPGYLLYPAQFWAHKNHLNLLLALRRLRDLQGLVLSVAFVGTDKGNLGYLREKVNELGLTAHVHFLGFVSRDELIRLYRNALALTYVSFCGPENLPPLEAFALGCPVIAAEVPGATEQLGDAAVLVDPKDPDEIARAIYTLFRDPELRGKLVARGAERARKWTSDDFVKAAFKLLDDFEPIRRSWR